MPKPFDATLKELVQAHPRDWLALLEGPTQGPVEVLTPDLSTVSAFADVVLRVVGGILHLDIQAGPDPDVATRMLLYNVLVHNCYNAPVHTVLVLLHRRADRSDLTGTHRYELWPGRGGVEFRFQVVRIWEVPVETLLAAGIGVAPLAPLGRLPKGVRPEEGLPGVFKRLHERLRAEAPNEAEMLMTAAAILSGLRLTKKQAARLYYGVRNMEESSVYQLILDEGRIDHARTTILRLGRKRLGPPTEASVDALKSITNLKRLERIIDRVYNAADWEKLLATR